jgi:hypothetical protein
LFYILTLLSLPPVNKVLKVIHISIYNKKYSHDYTNILVHDFNERRKQIHSMMIVFLLSWILNFNVKFLASLISVVLIIFPVYEHNNFLQVKVCSKIVITKCFIVFNEYNKDKCFNKTFTSNFVSSIVSSSFVMYLIFYVKVQLILYSSTFYVLIYWFNMTNSIMKSGSSSCGTIAHMVLGQFSDYLQTIEWQDLVNYVLWWQLFIGGEIHDNQRNQNIQPVVKNTNMY